MRKIKRKMIDKRKKQAATYGFIDYSFIPNYTIDLYKKHVH